MLSAQWLLKYSPAAGGHLKNIVGCQCRGHPSLPEKAIPSTDLTETFLPCTLISSFSLTLNLLVEPVAQGWDHGHAVGWVEPGTHHRRAYLLPLGEAALHQGSLIWGKASSLRLLRDLCKSFYPSWMFVVLFGQSAVFERPGDPLPVC